MNIAERIERGAAAIAVAKRQGRDVSEWQMHLEKLKASAVVEELPPRAWVHEEIRDAAGNLQAVIICSEPLDDFHYLVLDSQFEPKEPHAIYYPQELQFLQDKTADELKSVHQIKLIFPGARVVQP